MSSSSVTSCALRLRQLLLQCDEWALEFEQHVRRRRTPRRRSQPRWSARGSSNYRCRRVAEACAAKLGRHDPEQSHRDTADTLSPYSDLAGIKRRETTPALPARCLLHQAAAPWIEQPLTKVIHPQRTIKTEGPRQITGSIEETCCVCTHSEESTAASLMLTA